MLARFTQSTKGRCFALITLMAFAVSCATTKLPPISASGAAFKPESDEKRLWESARSEERKLLDKMVLYEDPLLEDYLQGLVNRLDTPGMRANEEVSYKIRVVEDPTLNAFAFPHGAMYVHTGLLARVENEDQLATIIGHEMTHVENRHTVRYQRQAQNRQIAFAAASIAAAVIIADQQGRAQEKGRYREGAMIGVLSQVMIGLGLQLAFLASVNGYGRDLEREADEGGYRKLSKNGYDIREAPKVFQLLKNDHGEQSKAEVFFFGSHPRLTERIESARAYASTHSKQAGTTGEENRAEFEKRLRPVVRDDAGLNIRMGRLKLAEDQLERVAPKLPKDPEVQFQLGRLRLAQAEKAKSQDETGALRRQAKEHLLKAIDLDDKKPAYHRELGVLAYRTGDPATACRSFERFLALDGGSKEADTIRGYKLELERDGKCR